MIVVCVVCIYFFSRDDALLYYVIIFELFYNFYNFYNFVCLNVMLLFIFVLSVFLKMIVCVYVWCGVVCGVCVVVYVVKKK